MDEDARVFIKKCWNERCSDSEFLERFHSAFESDEQRNAITRRLMELCGKQYEPTQFILKYLFAVVSEDPCLVSSVVDYTDEQVLGCIRLFEQYGGNLFATLTIGKEESAKWAVNALRMVLAYPSNEESKLAMAEMMHSPFFSILLASARVYAVDEFVEVRRMFIDKFQTRSFWYEIQSEIPNTEIYFWSALFADRVNNRHIWESTHALLRLISQTTYSWNLKERFLHFLNDVSHIYSHLIDEFVQSPTLTNAYIVTNLFPRVLASKSESANGVIPFAPYNRELVVGLVASLTDESALQNETLQGLPHEALKVPKIERKICEYTLYGLGRDKLTELLTKLPDHYDIENILLTVLEYPAFASEAVGIITKRLDDMTSTVALCDQILASAYDFTILLFNQGFFVSFLVCLANVMNNTLDDFHFEKLWYLLNTMLRYTAWRSGSRIMREQCLQVLEQCDPALRDLLSVVIGIKKYVPTQSFQTLQLSNQMSPANKLYTFYNYLMTTGCIGPHTELTRTYPYLWQIAADWGMITRDKSALCLSTAAVPPYHIAFVSFYHLMMVLVKPLRACEAVYDYPDYDLILEFPPGDISKIQHWIISDITSSMKTQPVQPKRAWITALKWRAWIQIFSLETFIRNLVTTLTWNIQSNTDPIYARDLFITAALLLVSAADEDPAQLRAIIRIIIAVIEEGSSTILDGAELAKLCVVLVISMRDQWKESFSKLLEIKHRMVTEESDSECSKIIFALNLVRITLYISDLQNLMLPHMYEVLVLKQDWQTAIDFFIARSKNLP